MGLTMDLTMDPTTGLTMDLTRDPIKALITHPDTAAGMPGGTGAGMAADMAADDHEPTSRRSR